MTLTTLKRHLADHHVTSRTVDGRILALECYTLNREYCADWIDITGWSKNDLFGWLGY